MTERELFEDWFRTTNFYKNMIKSLIDHDYPIGALDRVGRKYKSIYVQLAFESWQAATQRDGFKFVPVDTTNIMDVLHGKCPCGSSRSPVVSDRQGYNLIHCFSCGTSKYIHEDN